MIRYIDKLKESNVAETILQQLGGNKFRAMVGPKYLGKGKDEKGNEYLSFRLPKSYNRINYVKVTYNRGKDTYDMEFGLVKKYDYKLVWEIEGVYAEDLQRIFTEKTGLDTHL